MEDFDTILVSLSKGNFLETDGITYWWVDEGSYKEIPVKTFKSFIHKKFIYPKRIDDETTCYYLSMETKESIAPEIRQKAANAYKLSQIKSFVNL